MQEDALRERGTNAEDSVSGSSEEIVDAMRSRVTELIDHYRAALQSSLDGLTEDEAKTRLVPSKTTLLGLVKHATYLEGFYFNRALTNRSFADIGIASTPDRSFTVTKADTIASVQQAYERRCQESRERIAELTFDASVHGDKPRAVWAIHLQMLRELAQHTGHADILREQVLDRRPR
ncbi:DUF664 domain-containing protein [Paramicrobacterium agarici]|uniref:Uncharacterized protein DUF664 n=1 Tax=Paramicrobacterium agarici TaxID=630514 RepID=A0A2A9DVJ0_9MICO|nr:DUF664 domain-containing protein [Microbacterium agarici]PFG30351.1 uncharacterized protein DUF664 [Microbacterium agarici]